MSTDFFKDLCISTMFHRNTFPRKLQVLLGFVFLSQSTEAAITKWIVPPLNAPDGAAAVSKKIPENLSPGQLTGININATSNQTSAKITYVMLPQPSGGMFSIDSSSGAIKFVKGVLDFEKTPSYVVRIRASDTTLGNGTVNVTLTLSNTPPKFSSKTFNKQICDGAKAGTSLTTLKAVDPGNTNVTYTIQAGGNTNNDFSIGAHTGVVSVATHKSLNMTAKSAYTLVVLATDAATNAPETATATLTVNVKTCSKGTSHFTFELPVFMFALLARLF